MIGLQANIPEISASDAYVQPKLQESDEPTNAPEPIRDIGPQANK